MITYEELTLREKQVYHYSRQTGATTAVVSSLYQGCLYEKYASIMPEVISSHDNFALQNNFDYLLYMTLLIKIITYTEKIMLI